MEAGIREGYEVMNYVGKAEQLLLGGQGQTEVPYSTEEQRLAAAQVLRRFGDFAPNRWPFGQCG